MRKALLRRGLGAAAALTLACATTMTGMSTAQATTPKGHHGEKGHHEREAVDVKLTANGIEAPDTGEGGLVHFHITTDDPQGRQLQVIRPNEGVTIETTLADLTKAVSQDPATAAAGISAVNAEAQALGGGFASPNVPADVTEPIEPGTVYLLDFTAFLSDPAHPVLRALQLCPGDDKDLAPFPKGIVIQEEQAAGPRFQVEDVTKAGDPILVHNSADEIHEMEIDQVKPGTTDADIQAFLDALAQGQQPTPPFTGLTSGLSAISPHHTALFQARNLPPGTYVLICFIPDDKTGIPHAFEGMHKVVVLS